MAWLLPAVLAVLALMVAGCQQPPSTEWRPTTTEPPHEKAALTDAERREVRGILRELARDHELSPDRQPQQIDWRDIRRVVDGACSEVFMAVAQVEILDDARRVYHIRTADEKPAELTVTRVGEGLTDYEAAAVVGVFRDETVRAAELVEQFEKHLEWLHQRRLAAIGR